LSDLPDQITLLPHGPSARMISEVIEHQPRQIKVIMHWLLDNPQIADHFSDGPHIVPGVFLAEQVAQSALLLAILDGLIDDGEIYTLGNLRCDFIAPAVAPCSVVAITSITARVRGFVGFQGECLIGNTPVARIKGVAAPTPACL
jgi:3-hydroxymyristoyl/3-hydroxydecanoyl-(acyl carrier protein) dehydratase